MQKTFVFLLLLCLTLTTQTASASAELNFTPLKPIYYVGEHITLDLQENLETSSRFEKVDLWVAIQLPSGNENWLFMTADQFNPLSSIPQPFRFSLKKTEQIHRILEIEVQKGWGGYYTFYALYVEEGKNPITTGFFHHRSNLARVSTILSNSLFAEDDVSTEPEDVVVGDIQYIEWEGSANGEWVSDANGDLVRFEFETGYMNFGETVYYNVLVDEESNFVMDGVIEGAVVEVTAENGDTIVALVAPDGTYLDIVGSESDLYVENTESPAATIASFDEEKTTLRSLSSADSQKRSLTSTSSRLLPAIKRGSNAVTEPSGERKSSVLQKKN
jgi:hypothetical protein